MMASWLVNKNSPNKRCAVKLKRLWMWCDNGEERERDWRLVESVIIIQILLTRKPIRKKWKITKENYKNYEI